AYACNPYFVFQLYHRGAFPEAMALAWLPGILWSIAAVRDRWNWLAAVTGMGCLVLAILCNLPGAVVTGYAVGLYLVTAFAVRRGWAGLGRGVLVAAGGVALGSFFWFAVWRDAGSVRTPDSDLAINPASVFFYHLGHHRYLFGGVLDWTID